MQMLIYCILAVAAALYSLVTESRNPFKSIIYVLGSIVIGAIPVIYFWSATVTALGIMLIAVGTGGIKPNVSAFGSDQFQLLEQVI